jgi:hypothetical protein
MLAALLPPPCVLLEAARKEKEKNKAQLYHQKTSITTTLDFF